MSERQRECERWAVFWYALLEPLLSQRVSGKGVGKFLRLLADREHDTPEGRRRFSRSTLWRRWKEYRHQPLVTHLTPRRRCDAGQSRHPAEVVRLALAIKKDRPARSADTINRILFRQIGQRIPRSTLERLLRQAGATRAQLLRGPRTKVRSRWTRKVTHELWVGDFQDGPWVWHNQQRRKSYLSAFIDCHSRYIVEGRYYLRENLDILSDTLLRAWAKHGASRYLYLDNAKVYHALGLKVACGVLNISILHRKVRDPAPGGLIETFFRTAQNQFESELEGRPPFSLEQLNSWFHAWLEQSYHQRVHSETQQTPQKRYDEGLQPIRQVDCGAILPYFYREEKRVVHRDFSDVRLHNLFFPVPPAWRGQKLLVRYDPFQPLDQVFLYTLDDRLIGTAVALARDQRPRHPTPPPPAPLPPPKFDYLQQLAAEHAEQLKEQAERLALPETFPHERPLEPGPDSAATADTPETSDSLPPKPSPEGYRYRWSLPQFLQEAAKLLGGPGQVTSFRPAELQQLRECFTELSPLTKQDWQTLAQATAAPTLLALLRILRQRFKKGT